MGADLFIVVGDGGVGKSSLIKSITSEDVYISSTLESGKCDFVPCTTYMALTIIRHDGDRAGARGDRWQTLSVP